MNQVLDVFICIHAPMKEKGVTESKHTFTDHLMMFPPNLNQTYNFASNPLNRFTIQVETQS